MDETLLTGGGPDTGWPADPYPGARPPWSWVHADGLVHRLRPAPWAVGGTPLDDWLAARGAPGLAGRVPVLAYGSNACPAKVGLLRRDGLAGPVVVLRCTTVGVAAAWCAQRRLRDEQLPAVLVGAPGRVEEHALWLATPDQRAVLDACEGRGVRYRLVHLEPPVEVRTEDGALVPRPLAYVTGSAARAPMLHRGRVVPVADLDQSGAQRLRAAGAVAAPYRPDAALPTTSVAGS